MTGGSAVIEAKPVPDTAKKRVVNTAADMSALLHDMVKKARREFRETGSPGLDAKFLKESVGALKELYDLITAFDGMPADADGVVVRLERELEEWGK